MCHMSCVLPVYLFVALYVDYMTLYVAKYLEFAVTQSKLIYMFPREELF